MMGLNGNGTNKSPNNFLNYKIVKCKNWEKDRTCKYGAHCTFAHGDNDLRKKTDNLYQMNPTMSMMMPMMVPPGMDMNQMQQIMLSNQLMMGMGVPGGIPQPSQDKLSFLSTKFSLINSANFFSIGIKLFLKEILGQYQLLHL